MSRLFFSIFFSAFLLTTTALGQTGKTSDIGFEVQAYPTGVIPGIHLEWGVTSQDGLLARIGYNIVRHRDLGVPLDHQLLRRKRKR